ncbi:NADPH:quinone reductase [Achromobacter denitrificans]|uniref:NADPH:quinone reductase n=1 Tax=Achromobacter denitrificans TaxID=32002 RepID=A0ABZ3FY07_ACHDE|nr:NADPH:quinone reductase [Achromobacter denitrificans]CAB3821502.1 Phthiocerol synthesis polyketide synthase type I PpsC [Achromobacter denitrificans]
MKAAFYETRGAASEVLRVGEMPEEAPGPGMVRVRVEASGVNPSDVKTRGGTGARPNPWPRTVPHQDGAGTIDLLGEGVDPARLGQRVWLYECQLDRPGGTAAQWVTVPQHLAVPLPDGVSFGVGAALGVPALTAWHACERIDAGAGRCVLVHGAVGAVGFYAAQMARLRGARVLASVSNAEQARTAAAAGIDTVPRGLDLPEAARQWLARQGREDFDAFIDLDFAGNLQTNLALAANGAHIAAYASDTELRPAIPVRDLMRRNLQLSFLLVYTMPAALKQRAVEQLGNWLAAGALRHPAIHPYALDDIASAHEAVETRRHAGKVVVLP